MWPGWGWALRNFSGVSPVLERVFLREGVYQAKDLLIRKVGGLGLQGNEMRGRGRALGRLRSSKDSVVQT